MVNLGRGQLSKKARRQVKKQARRYLGSNLAQVLGGPISVLKYLPESYGANSFAIPMEQGYENEGMDDGLGVPPRHLWLGYGSSFGDRGKEWYVTKGKRDIDRMLDVAITGDFTLTPGSRILEMGCATGRMIRHLKPFAESSEIWGVDVSAPLINWCKANLCPPFNFATTTQLPHLPFEDSYFDLIYTGSVFTHIDDLAEAWLLELRRIVRPKGRLYVTIHDRHTIKLLDDGYYYDRSGYFTDKDNKEVELTTNLNSDAVYIREKDNFGMLVVGRDYDSNVFYDIDYFRRFAGSMCAVLSVTEEAYGHQTAVLLEKKDRVR
jgi:SAM-dependent methyltransferase